MKILSIRQNLFIFKSLLEGPRCPRGINALCPYAPKSGPETKYLEKLAHYILRMHD